MELFYDLLHYHLTCIYAQHNIQTHVEKGPTLINYWSRIGEHVMGGEGVGGSRRSFLQLSTSHASVSILDSHNLLSRETSCKMSKDKNENETKTRNTLSVLLT